MTDANEPLATVDEATPDVGEVPEWATEIDALARTPIAGADEPTGEKLYDQAAYEALDAEIKKPQAITPEPTDQASVDGLARGLIEGTSKDIKVAGYLGVSLVERKGARGHALAAVLIAGLAESFGASLWPRRPRGRSGAIDWMGERFVPSAEALTARAGDVEALSVAANAARRAHESLKEAFGEPVDVRFMRKWADALDKKLAAAERAGAKPEKEKGPDGAALGAAGAGGGAIPAIESAKDARAALIQMRKSMETAARVLRAEDLTDPVGWRVHRLAQWPDKLAFEIGANGATPIPMLDAKSAEEQLRTFEAERDEGVLERIEKTFAERPFWLDLQRVLAQAMEAFGPRFDGARLAVTAATAELVTRCPELPDARFASDVPFCNAATRAWLTGARGGASGAGTASGSSDEPASTEVVLDACGRAQAALAKDGLRGALSVFQEALASPSDLRTCFRLRLALAQTCVKNDQPALGLPHLAELREDLARRTVKEWAPELAIEVLAASVEGLRKESKKRGTAPAIEAQAAEALEELSRLDPLRALDAG